MSFNGCKERAFVERGLGVQLLQIIFPGLGGFFVVFFFFFPFLLDFLFCFVFFSLILEIAD